MATLSDAYPLARPGLRFLDRLLDMTHAEWAAAAKQYGPEQIAAAYLEAKAELERLRDEVLRPVLNRVTQDNFLAHGSDAVERAVRAHASEDRAAKARLARLRVDTCALLPVAEWERQLAEREAYADAAERRADAREVQARTYVAFFDYMRKASRQVSAPLTVRYPPLPSPLGRGAPLRRAAHA